MARSVTKPAATAKTKIPVIGEGNSSLTMRYYVNGTFSETPPKLKLNTETTSQVVSGHQPQKPSDVADTKSDDKLDAEAQNNAAVGFRKYTEDEMAAAQALREFTHTMITRANDHTIQRL